MQKLGGNKSISVPPDEKLEGMRPPFSHKWTVN